MTKLRHRKHQWLVAFVVGIVSLLVFQPGYAQSEDLASISGRVVDPQGLPVEGAEVVVVIISSQASETHVETNHDGVFLIDFLFNEAFSVRVDVHHPHFQSSSWNASEAQLRLFENGEDIRIPDINSK